MTILDFDFLQKSFTREKDKEKISVFREILYRKNITRKQIIQDLSLRPSTVSHIVAELLEDGIISESQSETKAGRGRPEVILQVQSGRFRSISFTVISMSLLGSLFDLEGTMIKKITARLDPNLDSGGFVDVFNRLVNNLSEAIPQFSELIGLGFALPGLVDKKNAIWKKASRFPNLMQLNLNRIDRAADGILLIERNIDSLLRYAMFMTPELKEGTTLLVHWGHGIAISCAMDGQIIQAPNGLFGEIGHWDIDITQGDPGGNLESAAALSGMLKKSRRKEDIDEYEIKKNIGSGIFPDAELNRIKKMMQKVIQNLYLTFFPGRILILSPFVDSADSRRLESELKKQLPEFVDPVPEVRALNYRENGESAGIANSVYSSALRPWLQARW